MNWNNEEYDVGIFISDVILYVLRVHFFKLLK